MEEHDYIIDGFVFHSEREAKRAHRELDGVNYVREKGNLDDPEKLLQVYNRLIEQGLFETPIGIKFLRDLQDELRKIPYISEDMITPIDAGRSIPQIDEANASSEKKPKKTKRQKNDKTKGALEQTVKDTEIRGKLRVSIIINVALVVLVGIMLFIASTTTSPTVLNYENEVINKYEEWENELTQREKTVKEYEEKYGIDKEDTNSDTL